MTSDARVILDKITGDDAELRWMIDDVGVEMDVAQMVYDARNKAALTQVELVRRIGTTQSVISRLEDAAYVGHSLTMLHRIAKALGLALQIRFVPRKPAPRRTRQRA